MVDWARNIFHNGCYMGEACVGCSCQKKSDKPCFSFRGLMLAFLTSLLAAGALVAALGGSVSAHTDADEDVACFETHDVAQAVSQGRCLVVFDGGVYDVSEAKKWDIEGHLSQHQCGGIYTKEAIEQGPHEDQVMDGFFVAPICGEEGEAEESVVEESAAVETAGFDLARPFGISWRLLFAYLAGIFFVLNFATCYAMPWARAGAPWAGEHPGEDERDKVGHFPLTHWHPWFAWGSVFFLGLHGILGFLCVWWGVCL